jgi:hypothetical protein
MGRGNVLQKIATKKHRKEMQEQEALERASLLLLKERFEIFDYKLHSFSFGPGFDVMVHPYVSSFRGEIDGGRGLVYCTGPKAGQQVESRNRRILVRRRSWEPMKIDTTSPTAPDFKPFDVTPPKPLEP